MIGGWRKSHGDVLHNLYSWSRNRWMIKSWMRWGCDISRTGAGEMCTLFLRDILNLSEELVKRAYIMGL